MSDILSLSAIPAILFLLDASREDARWLSIQRRTVLVWGAVALAGWWWGVWPLAWWAALAGWGTLWLAGVGHGDRMGGLIVGALIGWSALFGIVAALVACGDYCLRTHRSPAGVAFYPFLLGGTAVIIGYQVLYSLVDSLGIVLR